MSNDSNSTTLGAFNTDTSPTSEQTGGDSAQHPDHPDAPTGEAEAATSEESAPGADAAPIFERQGPSPVADPEVIDDADVRALIEIVDDEAVYNIVDMGIDADGLLKIIHEVCPDDDPIHESINVVRQGFTDNPAWVRAAGDQLARRLGFRPFDLEINDAKQEYMSDPIDFDMASGLRLTNSPALNAKILNEATRIRAVTRGGQERMTDRWGEALGEEQLLEFKQNRHPDALGFAIPESIPTTGDGPNTVPVTEIPYVGEATATDMHPGEGLLSLVDIATATDKQRCWIDSPTPSEPFQSDRTHSMVTTLVESQPEYSTELLVWLLELTEHESETHTSWLDRDKKFGIVDDLPSMAATTDSMAYDEFSTVADEEPVSDDDKEGSAIQVTTETGATATFSGDIWKLLSAVAETTGEPIKTASDSPAAVALPDGNSVMIPPRIQ